MMEQVAQLTKIEEELNHAKSELINRQTNYEMLEQVVHDRERELSVVEEVSSIRILAL
jgi:predicted  nucleic acid-binding Zn-ribbon protein